MNVQQITALAAVLSAGAAFADVQPYAENDLVIPVGNTVSLTESGKVNTSLDIHGGMTVELTKGARYDVYRFDTRNKAVATDISLGSKPGDAGVLSVTGGTFHGDYNNGVSARLKIGENGGGANARLTLTNVSGNFFNSFILCENAWTEAESFSSLELCGTTIFETAGIVNDNTKPLVVTFDGGDLRCFWSGPFFKMSNGGDVILQGEGASPITISSRRENSSFMSDDSTGFVRTRGDGDLVIMTSNGNAKNAKTMTLNSPNVDWGHGGNTVFRYSGTCALGHENLLPYGPDTGAIVLETGTATGITPLTLDLCGHAQKVNGLIMLNGSRIASTGGLAQLTFGTDDVDVSIAGVVDAPEGEVALLKVGDGCLTLADASLTNLRVDGGALVVSGAVTVARLSLENVVVSYADASSSLTVETWDVGDGVTVPLPDGAASNAVVSAMRLLPNGVVEKTGAGYLTCVTPDDARGTCLHIRNGTLRFGGTACDYTYWRFVAKEAWVDGVTFEHATEPSKNITAYLFLGGLALYDDLGRTSMYDSLVDEEPGSPVSSLDAKHCVSTNPFMLWDSETGKAYFGVNKDPILGGGMAREPGGSFLYSVKKDDKESIVYDSQDDVMWARGVVYTNGMLVAGEPSTYESVAWRESATTYHLPVYSYNLKAMVNRPSTDYPNVKSWEIQGSNDGVNWTTLDERSGQRPATREECGMDPDKRYTYNNHVPYLFSSKNANWKFNTFGVVQVDSGAVLELAELRTENISIGKLKVDLATGGGTITKFVPATDGVLYLENVPDSLLDAPGVLRRKCCVPLSLDVAEGQDRFATWSVFANGTKCENSKVSFRDGKLWVSSGRGLVLMVE